ncbi:DUF2787 domain-containing protein [Aeromonas caviae]|uniref:DUF2787 domain-containing protein n=1 Tax=Aeromonas caviae TaxID=648 RepID=UPI0021CEA3B0|nr:DUF2787 domain-containing protein [Aeromonas caviae]MCU7793911.1 DUF2787 domain-containing protein [Aeromonas caviae]
MTPSKPLQTLFAKIIGSYPDATALTLNFRSPDYSADTGGYRPVEVRLEKRAGSWGMAYVTEFTYLGGELVKDLDFDFNAGLASQLWCGERPLATTMDLYRLWERNFLDYHRMEVYRLKITPE